MFFVLFFLAILWNPSALACDRCCNPLFLTEQTASTSEVKNPAWMTAGAKTFAVKGFRGPGIVIHARSHPAEHRWVYFTKEFFEVFRRPVPADFQPFGLSTYSYSTRPASRGSGRDHLIGLASDRAEDRGLSVKGSGVNAIFPPKEFVLQDFRKNGMLELPAGLQEYALSQILMEKGFPIEAYEALVLAPASMHFATKPATRLRWAPVQITRRLEHGRASQLDHIEEIPLRKRLRLAAALYLWNIGHGSLNSENITKEGELLDLGHVSFGYPIYSSAYRCYSCVEDEGNSWDHTLVGPLDLVNGKPELSEDEAKAIGPARVQFRQDRYASGDLKSYSGVLDAEAVAVFVSELLSQILGRSVASAPVPEAIRVALLHTLREHLLIVGRGGPATPITSLNEWSFFDGTQCSNRETGRIYRKKDIFRKTIKIVRKWMGTTRPGYDEEFVPYRFALSLRFILQLAALPSLGITDTEWRELVDAVQDQILQTDEFPYAQQVGPLVRWFAEQFARHGLTAKRGNLLLEHPMTTDEMNHRIERKLTDLDWSEEFPKQLPPLLDELATVTRSEPTQFVQQVREWLHGLDEVVYGSSAK